MRNTKLMTLLAAGLVLFACQKERTEDSALVPGNHLTFTATIDGAETRTSVDGTKISWNPAEEINIFYGASEGSKFVSQNTEPSQSVTFSGTLTAFTGTTEAGEPNSFWAIYPYDESNSSSGSSVTAYLPENQVGVPNNVPDKALMMVAKASGLALSFKQVCARIKVVVSTPGIKKIEIRGNNDETIAGSAVITMNTQGLPEWQEAGIGAGKVIELVPELGTTFEVAEYSIPIYPQTFSAGFTMTCYKEGEKGSYSTGAVTFGRNQVRSVNTNKVTEWESLTFEYVDLGLSVKWATFNLGASKPEEYGDYYAWGETETKNYYSESDYKWFNYVEGSYSLTKYNSNSSFGVVDNKTVLEESDDVAHVKLGGNWRMATDTEWTELIENCTWTWTTRNGTSGRLVTSNIEGYTDRSIFLPAAGVWFGVFYELDNYGARGDYWSSSPCTDATDDPFCAWGVGINPTSIGYGRGDVGRCFGLSVRPVYDDSETVQVESITLDQSTLELYVGQTATLRATVLPANATNQTVVWRSVDTSIATVDQNGIITGVAEGSTVVIATNYNGMKQAECTVTVTKKLNNVIYYTSLYGSVINPYKYDFGANVVSNDYVDGQGIIIFDGDVTQIGNTAFMDCKGLSSIIIPESVTSIGAGAFTRCKDLTAVNIPENVTSIGGNAFGSCPGLTTITIPEGVTIIGDKTFYACTGLTSITIPEGVTSIGDSAFGDCSSLTTISIPEGVTSIGSGVFGGCKSLTSIAIPASVTSFGAGAFSNCSSLVSITIPTGITSIGSKTFYGCSSLASITIPAGVTSIGEEAFAGCAGLTSVILPEGITSIENLTFDGCDGLTSITIPESVTSIGSMAFYNCTSLSTITIPKNVTSIGAAALKGCQSPFTIYILAEIPPVYEISPNGHYAITTYPTVYVPLSSYDQYKADAFWGDSWSINLLAIPE